LNQKDINRHRTAEKKKTSINFIEDPLITANDKKNSEDLSITKSDKSIEVNESEN
jgi:hypothetical protein